MNQLRFFRKGLTLLFLLAISFSQSQTINTTYKTAINAKFAGLDKTKVPTKLLINQAMEFAELTDYAGAMSTTNFTTKGKLTNIYNTLLMSRVQTNVAGLINPNTFRTNWDKLRAKNKIVLSGLYFKYNKFKTNAYPNFLVNNNDVITDKYVKGVWQNPYIEQQVFAIAAPILVYKSLSLQVTLPASLWYTNQATSVQSIAIDFGNGAGYQTMTLGQVRTINYAASGTYEWKYKLTLTNAQVLYSHSKLKIDIPVLPPTPTDPNGSTMATQAIVNPTAPSCANIATIPFTGIRQYLGATNSATLQIRYTQSDCIIRKPLIVVEGFDSGLLGVENPFGENDIITFAQEAFFDTGNLPFEIINKDIIYINFNNGRDDLRRNAYLVEDIIKWVNTQKAQAGSTTPNVVIGQSMGGVIGRYALRDMEVQQALNPTVTAWQHKTNLFVSHDAPQQGANIPVGIQYFARHLADQFIDTPVGDYQIPIGGGSTITIEDIQNLLNAQGTKQLLANYISSGFALNNTTFNTFQTELRNLGYPTQTRNIALSNGNHCANPQEFNPSAPLFNLYGDASTTAFTTLLTTLLQPLTGIGFAYLAYEFAEPGLLLGILPGSSRFTMNFNAYALPAAGTNNQVYSGSVSYTKKIFSLFGWNPQITAYLTNRNYNNPVGLSYDYYPGGKYQLPLKIQSPSQNPFLSFFINLGVNVYLAPSFNFIPVPSALDIGSGATPLDNSDYLKKYNAATPPQAPKNSPFVNFTTSFPNGANINEPHISFNTRNGNWLATELDTNTNNNQVFDCSFLCSDAQIIGSNLLCNSASYAAPATTSFYNWSITQGASLVTLSGNGTPSAILTAQPNASGAITLSLTMGDNGARCGNTTITKTIWVGKPNPNYELTREEYCNFNYRAKEYYNNNSNATFSWQYVSGTGGASSNNFYTFGDFAHFTACPPFTITLKLIATNSCGTTERLVDFWLNNGEEINRINPNNTNVNSNDIKTYTIYPNPSNDIVTVDLRNQNNLPEKGATISGELFDMMGQSKAKIQIIQNQATFSVRGLNKGIYVLKIYINNQVETHQIAVQ